MKQQAVALFIEGTYPWYRGGVSEWVHQYIHAFPDLEFNIIQVATDEYRDADLSTALYQVPDQVNSLTRVPPPPKGISNIGEANGWFDAIAPKINAISSQSNLLHVANTGFAGWLGLKAARQYRSPLILTEHALYWKEVQMGAAALECAYQVPNEETEKAAWSDFSRQWQMQFIPRQITLSAYLSAISPNKNAWEPNTCAISQTGLMSNGLSLKKLEIVNR